MDRFFDAHPAVSFLAHALALTSALTAIFYLGVWTGTYQRTVAEYVEPALARAVPFWMRRVRPFLDAVEASARRRLDADATR